MALMAWLVERFVLGPLVNQDGLTLFMSTIGVTFILDGASQMIFGSDVYPLRLFPTDAWFLFENAFPGGILVNKLDVWGGLIAGILGLSGIAGAATQIAWILFVVFLVLFLVSLVMGRRPPV